MRQFITRRSFLPSVFLLLALAASPGIAGAATQGHDKPTGPAATKAAVPLSDIHVFGGVPIPFGLDAHSGVIIDGHSGTVLYSYNPNERMQPASLAKMMTFYLTLKALKEHRITLDTKVTISKKAWELALNPQLSRMFLTVGHQVPIRKLLYGLVVSSGNDAAVTLAQFLAGSTGAFVPEMNAEAERLGLHNTHFMNPDGLPAQGQYSTARDMTELGRALIENFPGAVTYTSTKDFTYDHITQPNFNTLLFHDSRVDGLKTGHVEEAGYHLVASAHSHGMLLISCVMGTPSDRQRWVQSEKLISWAFRTFASVHPDLQKIVPASLPVYSGVANQVAIAPVSNPWVTVVRGEQGDLRVAYRAKAKYVVAPVRKGEQVGEAIVTLKGKELASVPVVAQANIGPGSLIKRMADSVQLML